MKVCGQNPKSCGIIYLENEKFNYGSKIDSNNLGIDEIIQKYNL